MLIGIELRGQSISVNELIVVGHLRTFDDVFIAVILFGDHPHVRRSGNILRAGDAGEQHTHR
jgi:hypothetical protein